jgi:cobyrinic acid a,c-diamide synthase
MIAATNSGAGKTTITLALLSALQKRGISPVAFKCGPDYIDPMFHRAVLSIPSYNLDLFFTDEPAVCGLLCAHSNNSGVAVIEGVMGYYDGIGGSTRASSYALAKATETPVILVVSVKGASLSTAAVVNGFKEFRKPSMIAGVILNDCSETLYNMLKMPLETETGLKLLGYFPRLKECSIGSRHLGLVTATEIDGLKQKIEMLGTQAEKSIDIDALLNIAGSAQLLTGKLPAAGRIVKTRPRIAIAQDEAFCFYYADNLALLERFGAELVPFSPLHDNTLPARINALYLGGGYPELYAAALSANTTMLENLSTAINHGLPTLAECGGFLYLHETLEDDHGAAHSMAGVFQGHGVKTSRLQRFGYINLVANKDTLLCSSGDTIPAHEFHYWDTTQTGGDCTARKPDGREWPCVTANQTIFAGFPHLYFYGNPTFAVSFVTMAAQYKGTDTKNNDALDHELG